jgi:tetratricopeptide (TPR) repeat protein
MRIVLLAGFLLLQTYNPATISQENRLKEEAREAFLNEDYQKAADTYAELARMLPDAEPAIRLNRAHALLLAGQADAADSLYQSLALSLEPGHARSVAWQQLGFRATQKDELENAIDYFKQALKAEPGNERARYNYELALKKQQAEKERQQEQQQQNQQQQQEQQDPPEPSAWAEALKKRAEELARKRRYSEAFQLMQDGLQQDPTVAAYNDYIQKLQLISEINAL